MQEDAHDLVPMPIPCMTINHCQSSWWLAAKAAATRALTIAQWYVTTKGRQHNNQPSTVVGMMCDGWWQDRPRAAVNDWQQKWPARRQQRLRVRDNNETTNQRREQQWRAVAGGETAWGQRLMVGVKSGRQWERQWSYDACQRAMTNRKSNAVDNDATTKQQPGAAKVGGGSWWDHLRAAFDDWRAVAEQQKLLLRRWQRCHFLCHCLSIFLLCCVLQILIQLHFFLHKFLYLGR